MAEGSDGIQLNFQEVGAEVANPQPEKFHTGISIDRANRTAPLVENAIHAEGGRIPYSRFMDISLFGPGGYYSTGKVDIKEKGDFVTFPSNEPFNQAVGNSVLKVWEAMGKPGIFNIVEMGAGTGIMAKDMLVWARKTQPEFYNALRYVILEYGDLRKQQRDTIGEDKNEGIHRNRQLTIDDNTRDLEKVRWVQGSASELPLRDIEGVFISNELPDAFPVEFVKNVGGKVKQKYVSLENDQWVEIWDEPSEAVLEYLETYKIALENNGAEEPVNLNAAKWQKELDMALKKGAVITIDYGKNGTTNGKPDKLARRLYPLPQSQDERTEYSKPGDVDITSDINFAVLEQLAIQDGLSVAFAGEQLDFLLRNKLDVFWGLSINEMKNTPSINRKLELYKKVPTDLYLYQEQGKAFYTQVLTRGVDLQFSPRADNPSFDTFSDIGIKLKIGSPNGAVTIDMIDTVDETIISQRTVQLDPDGNLDFFKSDINPLGFFRSKDRKWIIREGVRELLDTSNKDALKQVVENSKYNYDLVA